MPPAARGRARRPLREFELIEDIQKRFGATHRSVVRGIGDDAAVIRPAPGRDLLITTDLLAESVHFDRTTTTWEHLGFKAAAANLSDIAAMGGRPEHLLVSLAVPPDCRTDEIHDLYRGLMKACRPYGIELVGGDTSASQDGLFVSLTVTGSVTHGTALTRDGARVGDLLYVTGTLGDSLAGLQLLQPRLGKTLRRRLARAVVDYLIARHFAPTPRIDIGQLLSIRGLASAAIDLSDGLSGDVRHICRQSRVGVEIEETALPLSQPLKRYAETKGVQAADLALQGGEDYELLLTVPPSKVRLLERTARRLRCPLTRIGRICPKRVGIVLKDRDGMIRPLPPFSYEHFHNSDINREAACSH